MIGFVFGDIFLLIGFYCIIFAIVEMSHIQSYPQILVVNRLSFRIAGSSVFSHCKSLMRTALEEFNYLNS